MDDRHGYYFEDLSPGMSAVFSKTVTEADLLMFAGVSGDTNPLHLDEDFASRTMFESRIAHGMLTASLVSTVLGTRLPGPGAVYVSQSIRFLAPVRIGDTVIARAADRRTGDRQAPRAHDHRLHGRRQESHGRRGRAHGADAAERRRVAIRQPDPCQTAAAACSVTWRGPDDRRALSRPERGDGGPGGAALRPGLLRLDPRSGAGAAAARRHPPERGPRLRASDRRGGGLGRQPAECGTQPGCAELSSIP